MNQLISYPQSTICEFYCYRNRMSLDAYRKEGKGAVFGEHETALGWLAEVYDEITYDVYNRLFVVEKNGKYNFIFEADLLAFVPAIYDFYHIYPGFAVVRKGNQIGNLFFHEGLSEPASYRTANVFEVKRGGFFGVETATGDTLLACTFRFVKIYSEYILAQSDEGYSLYHLDGTKMFDDDYFSDVCLTVMRNGFIFVQKNEL